MTDIQSKPEEILTYGGSATTVVAGLTVNELGMIVGIIAAAVGIFFQVRRDRREKALFELRRKRLEGGDDA